MVNKSAAKGGAYERKIRDTLSEHFKIQFERVPSSGALHYLKGDVWAPHHMHIFPYTIECKHYKELDFNSLLTAKSNPILGFWVQTVEQAVKMKKKPLLIFRWNRSKDFVAWDDEVQVPGSQLHYQGFGLTFKIAELSKWLPQVNIKLN